MAKKSAEKKRVFAIEYLVDRNATRAAIAAGCSAKTAYSAGSRLLKDPEVQALIKAGEVEAMKRNQVTVDWVIKRLMWIADADIRRAYDSSGKLKAPRDLPGSLARAISGIEIDEIWDGYGEDRHVVGETKKVRLTDRVRALELLGRNLKMFSERVVVDFSDRLASRLEEARKRVDGKRGAK